MLRINHLYFFLAVAQTSSINVAAQKLNITPPAISHALKEFESDLNLTLFNRSSKGVTLTPEGAIVAEKVKKIIADLDELESISSKIHLSSPNIPKVDCLTLFSEAAIFNSHLNSLSDKLYKQFPNLDLIIAEQPLKKVITEISADPSAIAILLIGSDLTEQIMDHHPELDAFSFINYPLQILVNKNTKFFPHGIPESVTFADIKDLPFIQANWYSSAQHTLSQLSEKYSLNHIAIAPNLSAFNAFLANDIGIGLGCNNLFTINTSQNRYVPLITTEDITINYALLYNKSMNYNLVETLKNIANDVLTSSIKYSFDNK